MKVRILAGVLVVMALSGCIGGEDLEVESAPEDGTAEATPTARMGSVEGQVRRDNLDPIEGAIVILNDGQRPVAETETDGKGAFTMNDIAPGFYRIIFTASCCRDDVREIAVKEGQITKANAMLAFIPTQDPFVEQNEWNGFIGCAVHGWGAGGNNELCDEIDPNTDRVHQFTVDEGIRSVALAMDWDPELTTISFLSEDPALRLRMYHGDDWLHRTYVLLDGGPPLQAVVQPSNGEGEWGFLNMTGENPISFQVWASGGWGGFTYQQSFTVYYDVYYWERAPDGASALPDS